MQHYTGRKCGTAATGGGIADQTGGRPVQVPSGSPDQGTSLPSQYACVCCINDFLTHASQHRAVPKQPSCKVNEAIMNVLL